jgi:hypothetical protein
LHGISTHNTIVSLLCRVHFLLIAAHFSNNVF